MLLLSLKNGWQPLLLESEDSGEVWNLFCGLPNKLPKPLLFNKANHERFELSHCQALTSLLQEMVRRIEVFLFVCLFFVCFVLFCFCFFFLTHWPKLISLFCITQVILVKSCITDRWRIPDGCWKYSQPVSIHVLLLMCFF